MRSDACGRFEMLSKCLVNAILQELRARIHECGPIRNFGKFENILDRNLGSRLFEFFVKFWRIWSKMHLKINVVSILLQIHQS